MGSPSENVYGSAGQAYAFQSRDSTMAERGNCDSPTAIRQLQLPFAYCDSPTAIRQQRFTNCDSPTVIRQWSLGLTKGLTGLTFDLKNE